MKIIAFDVMGNDNGVKAAVEASKEFVLKNPGFQIKLVGDEKEILKYLEKESEQLKIFNIEETVKKDIGILALRKEKSSMGFSINLVKDKKADIVVSSGDSGAFLSLSTLLLKRIDKVKRPAFMPVFPTVIKNKKFLMLDVGANLNTSAQMLVEWAKLGTIFAKEILKAQKPQVAIVNIGKEKGKGFEFHNEANEILEKGKLNYKGFVEPRELLDGKIDVAVVDGYAGNCILKTMEGTVMSFVGLMRKTLRSKFIYKLGALLSRKAFRGISEQLDYRNVGSAWVIGLQNLALKTHGSSDKKSYLGAFEQIKIILQSDFVGKIKKEFK